MQDALREARTALEQSEAESSRLCEQSVEGLSPTQVKKVLKSTKACNIAAALNAHAV